MPIKVVDPPKSNLFIMELTLPWDAAVEEAFECKKLRYSDLADEPCNKTREPNPCPDKPSGKPSHHKRERAAHGMPGVITELLGDVVSP